MILVEKFNISLILKENILAEQISKDRLGGLG